MKPYIGICDFTSPEQTERLLRSFPFGFSHELMVGVMMSYKTPNNIPTQWANVFPQKEKIAGIMSIVDPRVLHTIHYADYAVWNDADQNLSETLSRVQSYGGPRLDAIQLDMIWPDPDELRKFRRDYGIPIILQVGEDAMIECKEDPIAVCARLNAYTDTIDYVLFDRSMGRGKGMNTALLAQYVGVAIADCSHLLPAVAGGLGPSSMSLVAPPLVHAYPNISMDMQSKIRPSGDIHDPINWDMAEDALRKAVALYQR